MPTLAMEVMINRAESSITSSKLRGIIGAFITYCSPGEDHMIELAIWVIHMQLERVYPNDRTCLVLAIVIGNVDSPYHIVCVSL